jgi:LacI family transcriptional regulator
MEFCLKVTLKDLAKICGCSVTSVSRALKNSDTISKELRDTVQSKARELGYVPNLLAGSMRSGYTNTIALIIQDLRNPFYSLLAKYVEEYSYSLGYSIIIMTTNEDPEREKGCVISAIQKGVDGILYLPLQRDEGSIELLRKNNVPFVLVGRLFDDSNCNYVVVDDKKGAYLVTDHLIKQGNKRILFLNSFMHIYSARQRLAGFQLALQENNLPFIESDVLNISMGLGETNKVINELFEHKNPYTALFCFCDIMAFEAIYSLNKLGYRVPEDLAVAANDDIHSDIVMPIKVTTCGFSRKEMAQYAVDELINNIRHVSGESQNLEFFQHTIDTYLSLGQTT